MQFFERFGDKCKIILCDDADGPGYQQQLRDWAKSRGREIKVDGRSAVILEASA